MTTDTSQWYDLNSAIKIVETNKKFYKFYMHKLVYTIPGSYAVANGNSIEDVKKIIMRTYPSDIVAYKLSSILAFHQFYIERRSYDVRCRIERNTVSIFAKDSQTLYQLATNQLSSYIPEILSTVTCEKTRDSLDKGFQIMKQETEYKFKVNIRDGFYKIVDDRRHLANYLQGLGDEVKITKNILSALGSSNKYMSSGYFYVKDLRVVDLIKLIAPTVIRSVQPIVVH